jgi:tetratricopeptide (TPR) repeat protein
MSSPSRRRPARINLRLIALLSAAALILAVGAMAGHRYRRRAMADSAFSVGTAAWQRRDFPEASRQLRNYLAHHPDDSVALERFAQANLAIRPVEPERVMAATSAYRRLLRILPDDPRLWRELVKLYSGTAQHVEAAYICRSRLERHSDDEEARYLLGKALAAQHKCSEVSEVLSRLVEKTHANPAHHRRQVQAYGLLSACAAQGTAADKMNKARNWLDEAVAAFPESAEAYVQRARFFRTAKGDAQAAFDDLSKATPLTGNDPTVQLLLMDEWVQWNQPKQARALMDRLDVVTPEWLAERDIDPEAWAYNLLSIQCRLALLEGRCEEAYAVARRALDELPGFRRIAFLPLAVEVYLRAGQVAAARAAVDEYRQDLRQRPNAPDVSDDPSAILLARVFEAEGDPVAVIQTLDGHAVSTLPPVGLKLLWRAFDQTGQLRRAEFALRDYVARAGDDTEALTALAQLNRGRDWAQVMQWASRAEQLDGNLLEAKVLRLEAQLHRASHKESGRRMLQTVAHELRNLHEAHPRHGMIRILQAAVDHRLGNADQARTLLLEAQQQWDLDPRIDLAIVDYHVAAEADEEARNACEEAIRRHPHLAEPRLRLASLGAPDASLIEAALLDGGDSLTGIERLKVVLALAEHRRQTGLTAQALELLQSLTREFPNDARPRVALLAMTESGADPSEDQGWIDDLKRIEGLERGVQWRLAQAQRWLGADPRDDSRVHEALALLEQCIRNDPVNPAPVLALGRALEENGKIDAAESTYQRYLDASDLNVEVAYRLLRLLERQDRASDAELLLRRMSPDAPLVSRRRLTSALEQGDFAAALSEIDRRLSEDPHDASLHLLKARLHFARHKNAEEAQAILDEAQRIDPELREIPSVRALILHTANRPDEALALLNGAVQEHKDVLSFLARGKHFAATGQDELARRDFLQAGALDESSVEPHTLLARMDLARGRPDPAVETCRRALERHADHVALRLLLADALSARNQPDDWREARRVLDKLRDERPNDAVLPWKTAELILRERNTTKVQEAEELLERAIVLDARLTPAHVRLIELARQRGDRREMERLLKRAVAADPENQDLRLLRAGVEFERGDGEAAVELAQSVLEAAKSSPRGDEVVQRVGGSAALLAEAAMRASDLAAARRWSDEALLAAPNHEPAHLLQARVLDGEGRTEEAVAKLKALRTSIKDRPGASYYATLADLHRRARDYTAADAVLREALAAHGPSPALRMTELRLLAAQRRFTDLAERALNGTPAGTPFDIQVALLGAALSAESGEVDALRAAQSICEEVIAREPDDVDGHLAFARVAHRQKDLAAVQRGYRAVLQINPYHAAALNDLAWILANELGEPNEALALAERGVARFPDDVQLRDTRGVVYSKLGRLDDARRDLEVCLATARPRTPVRVMALFHLGRVELLRNDRAAANARFREALELDGALAVLTESDHAEIRDALNHP